MRLSGRATTRAGGRANAMADDPSGTKDAGAIPPDVLAAVEEVRTSLFAALSTSPDIAHVDAERLMEALRSTFRALSPTLSDLDLDAGALAAAGFILSHYGLFVSEAVTQLIIAAISQAPGKVLQAAGATPHVQRALLPTSDNLRAAALASEARLRAAAGVRTRGAGASSKKPFQTEPELVGATLAAYEELRRRGAREVPDEMLVAYWGERGLVSEEFSVRQLRRVRSRLGVDWKALAVQAGVLASRGRKPERGRNRGR